MMVLVSVVRSRDSKASILLTAAWPSQVLVDKACEHDTFAHYCCLSRLNYRSSRRSGIDARIFQA
jgi:hypothetical protein